MREHSSSMWAALLWVKDVYPLGYEIIFFPNLNWPIHVVHYTVIRSGLPALQGRVALFFARG